MNTRQVGSNVIDFEARLQQKRNKESLQTLTFIPEDPETSDKRYEYIKSKCQKGNVDLLDSLVSEVELTEEAIFSVMDYMKAAPNRGQVATTLFEASILLQEDAFYEKYGINWWITIEDALTYLAMAKQEDEQTYKLLLAAAVLKCQ